MSVLEDNERCVRIVRPDLELAHLGLWLTKVVDTLAHDLVKQLVAMTAASGGAYVLDSKCLSKQVDALQLDATPGVVRLFVALRALGRDAWPVSLVCAAFRVLLGEMWEFPVRAQAVVSATITCGWPAGKRAWVDSVPTISALAVTNANLPTYTECLANLPANIRAWIEENGARRREQQMDEARARFVQGLNQLGAESASGIARIFVGDDPDPELALLVRPDAVLRSEAAPFRDDAPQIEFYRTVLRAMKRAAKISERVPVSNGCANAARALAPFLRRDIERALDKYYATCVAEYGATKMAEDETRESPAHE